jgi:hypothetical protein
VTLSKVAEPYRVLLLPAAGPKPFIIESYHNNVAIFVHHHRNELAGLRLVG